ncbi:VOC family protein [Glutamicibacter endophyticus]|uniref:VOC family protein n=1 Tax=Glutamicibacter endophyticus TaxID=1522174 RepID=UPI003AF0AAE4
MNVRSDVKLSGDLAMSTVQLKVGDRARLTDYYQRALGLEVLSENSESTILGRGTTHLVQLNDGKGLQLPAHSEAGLFHTALLFEDRSDLAATVYTAAQYNPHSFVGSSDHLVSEAFYFTDPEGNGIELYFDRPRDTWTWRGEHVAMDTIALDPNDYLQTHLNENALQTQVEAAAAVGHVHLQVGDVATAKDFYVDTLGFDITSQLGDQALFVSAGGYHHHMAMNVWNSRGAGPRHDTLGLGEVLIQLPHADEVGQLAERLSYAGIEHHHTGAELRFGDPWRNRLRVAVA